jgi:hypothetical protein
MLLASVTPAKRVKESISVSEANKCARGHAHPATTSPSAKRSTPATAAAPARSLPRLASVAVANSSRSEKWRSTSRQAA